MKNLIVSIFTAILCSNSIAQQSLNAEYSASGVTELTVNEDHFIRLELAPKLDAKIFKSEVCDYSQIQKQFHPISQNLNDIIVAANFATTGLAAYGVLNLQNDKSKHFLAGYMVGTTVTGAAQLFLPKTMKNRKLVSALIGFGTSVIVGVGKELYDSRHPKSHTVDINDALVTFAGGAVGTVTINFADVKRVFSRKK